MTNADLATKLEILARDLRAIGDTVERCIRDHAQDGPAAQRFDRTGSSGSDTSDPTAQAAMRGRPVGMGRDNAQAWDRSTKAIGEHVAILGKLIRDHHPDAKRRAVATLGPCLGGVQHVPDAKGQKCAAKGCERPWPCNEAETESWWAPCTGSVQKANNRCGKCELPGNLMVCKWCGEDKPRYQHASGLCTACRTELRQKAS